MTQLVSDIRSFLRRRVLQVASPDAFHSLSSRRAVVSQTLSGRYIFLWRVSVLLHSLMYGLHEK